MMCPSCGCQFEVKNKEEENDPEDLLDGGSDETEEDMKKSVLDELMGLSNEARKHQLPKKGMVSIEMMKLSPKKKM